MLDVCAPLFLACLLTITTTCPSFLFILGIQIRPALDASGLQLLPSRVPLDFDQLKREKSRGTAFGGFSEADLDFPPTFKFDKGSDAYDSR